MKTLVIDDDNSCCAMFKMYLDSIGDCDTVSLGFEGVNRFKEAFTSGQPYDLVIIDIILPDINGNEVLEMIRTEENMALTPEHLRTKVVLTTSLDDEQNREFAKGLTKGLEAYYVKAFANEGLPETLQELGLAVPLV